MGVDFFFVLSGFIIVFSHVDDIGGPERVRLYLLKRFGRLFPIYWVYTLIFCCLMLLGFGSNGNLPHTVQNWISTIFLVRLDNFEMPIAPSWTLVHELAFYLVFAVIILNRAFGLLIMAAWLIIGGLVFQYAEEGVRQPLTTYFSPLNFNFLIGACAFFAWRSLNASVFKYAFPIGLLLFVAVYVLESRGLPYQWTQIPYALSFGLIIAGAAAWESNGLPTPRSRLWYLIGNSSYSIYLTHLAFLGLYAKIFIKMLGGASSLADDIIYLATLAMTIATGCVLYLLAERPLLKAYRRWLD